VNLVRTDVRKLARGDIEKMVVRLRVRVVENPRGIGDHFPDYTLLCQQAERVVYRGLGDMTVIRVDQTENVLRGQVSAFLKQQARDNYPLGSRVNIMAPQEFKYFRV
jgi:hypothetical protein